VSLALDVRGLVVRGEGGFRLGPVDLALARGQALAVVGRAGAGKSLLLSALAGLVPIAAGEVRVDGLPLDEEHLVDVRQRLGFAFQRDALFDEESALENVAFAVRARGLSDEKRRALEALRAVGLEAAADKLPSALSGGMRKRLGVARALAAEPLLLLGDSVTDGLDPSTAAEVLTNVFARVRTGEMAALLATHDVDAILPRVGRVLVLEGGRVVHHGAPEGLRGALEAFAPRRRAA
jgi:ABC-type multidrug transport system ATPase subunit